MTPKTFPKYIAKIKKQAAAEGWSQSEYESALMQIKGEMADQYVHGQISQGEYLKIEMQVDNATKNMALQGGSSSGSSSKSQANPMTMTELMQTETKLANKLNAGELTPQQYLTMMDKVNEVYHKNGSLSEALTVSGLDPGANAADAAVSKVEKQVSGVYKQAQKEMEGQLKELEKNYGPLLSEKHKALMKGEITQDEYNAWIKNYMAKEDALKAKIDQVATTATHANEKAMAIVNGETMNVFAENANYQAYQITQDAGMDLSFAVYDERSVERLIKDRPELLPRKVVNGAKDKAWNKTKIANAVTQSIIQGESIPDLAKRIAKDTASENGAQMVKYARTAMTSAQNGGRMESLHRAEAMGIKVKKRWLATLDSRTRDAHAELDGQVVGVDEPFKVIFQASKKDVPHEVEIMFPGDPSCSEPGMLYNCRCTLVYEYEDYPADPTESERRDNETGEVITDMSYKEWKTAKKGGELNTLNEAKVELAEAQKALVKANVDENKAYHNIWKDDVTLADYPDKKASIQAKKDYYTQEIEKIKTAQANGESWATDAKLKEKKEQLKQLKEFEKNGKLLEKRNQALGKVQGVYDKVGLAQTAQAPAVPGGQAKATKSVSTAGAKATPFGPEAYTQERKDKALWAKRPEDADAALRSKSSEVWQAASKAERDGIYEYTQSYHKYNEPLRGIEYGTSRKLGVGNTDLDAGYAHNGARLNACTDIIAKSTYDRDIWLQRGCGYRGMDDFFQCDMNLLMNGSQSELEAALLGSTPTEYAFMSCGSNKGAGLNVGGGGGITLNVYCPAGTQMMYVEPFSAYGGGSDGINWDGKSKQYGFGQEVETLMQQGTQFRVTKVERRGRSGRIYVDMEVINQDHQQRWKP